MIVNPIHSLKGELSVPGDKSISHRSVMLGSIANGTTRIHNFLQGADCLSTISCFSRMGISIENQGSAVTVRGKGLTGLCRPLQALDCGNSGTTTRLICGILAGQDFDVTLIGDASIRTRPMKRVIEPLTLMGANIESIPKNGCAPLSIRGSCLSGIHYTTKVASAQVKSAILLAGLYAQGETAVTEPSLSRDHTEIMLRYFGADVSTQGTTAVIRPTGQLCANEVRVPGDISSAAYFICAALMIPGSEILIRNVGVNPTRSGILDVCKNMGANIELLNASDRYGEPTADILARYGPLHGCSIGGAVIPTLIDELPMIAAMAATAEGETVICDAAELKVKESNRIEAMVNNLSAMGADITGTEDGMVIRGKRPLHGAVIDSRLDHRIAMTFAVAGLCAQGDTKILGAECVDISYPGFYEDLKTLAR